MIKVEIDSVSMRGNTPVLVMELGILFHTTEGVPVSGK